MDSRHSWHSQHLLTLIDASQLFRRRKERPAWQLLLGSRDFGAIMLLNAMMFMTQNGSRAVLVPLLATQAFGVTTTTLGALLMRSTYDGPGQHACSHGCRLKRL